MGPDCLGLRRDRGQFGSAVLQTGGCQIRGIEITPTTR